MRWVIIWRWVWTVFVCAVLIGGVIAFVGCLWSLPGCSLLRIDLPNGITGPAPGTTVGSPPPAPGSGPPDDSGGSWWPEILAGLIVVGKVADSVDRRYFHGRSGKG